MCQPLDHHPLLGAASCVALGGSAGSAARWALTEAIGAVPGLVVVNVLGCFLIGAVYGALDRWPASPWWIKPLLGTGFLGGFTTFSTATFITSALTETEQWGPVMGLLVGLPLTCLVGVWLGNLATRQWAQGTGSMA